MTLLCMMTWLCTTTEAGEVCHVVEIGLKSETLTRRCRFEKCNGVDIRLARLSAHVRLTEYVVGQ